MAALHLAVPLAMLLSSGWRWLGALFIGAGLGLNIWSDQLFKRAGTAVKPFDSTTSLIVAGPFVFSRNPMYLGMVLLLAGVAVALGSVTPWLVIPVFAWQVTQQFIIPEERKLESAFGEQYAEYKRRVRRWL